MTEFAVRLVDRYSFAVAVSFDDCHALPFALHDHSSTIVVKSQRPSMSHAFVHDDRVRLHNPVYIDGLPGLGLVGKIVADHLIEEFDMTYFASIECPALPPVVAYGEGASTVLPPVRVYADKERDLLALQSDVPVSPDRVADFASCLSRLLADYNALPLYFSGTNQRVDEENLDGDREVYGIATGTGHRLLERHSIQPPRDAGIWSGPTGALLDVARVDGTTSLGIIVESHSRYPDPVAACLLIERVVEPIAGVNVDVDSLRDQAETIRQEKQSLAAQMEQSETNESSEADSRYMYQ